MLKNYKLDITITKEEIEYLISLLKRDGKDISKSILLSIEYQKLEQELNQYNDIIDFE